MAKCMSKGLQVHGRLEVRSCKKLGIQQYTLLTIPVLCPNWFPSYLVPVCVHALYSPNSSSCGLPLSRDSSHIHKHITGDFQVASLIYCGEYDCISQWFPTGGTRTPRGTQAHRRGYVETFNNHLCYVILFENHQHGGTHGMTNRLRGYTRQKRLGNTGISEHSTTAAYENIHFRKYIFLQDRVKMDLISLEQKSIFKTNCPSRRTTKYYVSFASIYVLIKYVIQVTFCFGLI